MADDELDLTKGDPDRAAKIAAAQEEGKKAHQARKASSSGETKRVGNSGATRQKSTASSRLDSEMRDRLNGTLDRIVKALIEREDHELGQAISEDQGAIVQGFISITRAVTWLRSPLLIILNLVDPILAFWRVGRILLGRWYERRVMRAQQAQQAQYEQQVQDVPPQPVATDGGS